MSGFRPLLSKDKVLSTVEEVKTKQIGARQYAQKYLEVAAIGEISQLTPQNIRLIKLRMSDVNAANPDDTNKQAKENAPQAPKEGAAQAPAAEPDNVIIEGIILGGRDTLESSLTQYTAKLDGSPIFNKVTVKKKDMVKFKKDEVLHFILGAKVG